MTLDVVKAFLALPVTDDMGCVHQTSPQNPMVEIQNHYTKHIVYKHFPVLNWVIISLIICTHMHNELGPLTPVHYVHVHTLVSVVSLLLLRGSPPPPKRSSTHTTSPSAQKTAATHSEAPESKLSEQEAQQLEQQQQQQQTHTYP
jgi:hypothetical protein